MSQEDELNAEIQEGKRMALRSARAFRIWFLFLFLVAVLGNVLLPKFVDAFARSTQTMTRASVALFGMNWIEFHGSILVGGFLAQLVGLATWMAIGKGFFASRYLVGVVSAFVCAVMLLIGIQHDSLEYLPVMGYVVTGVGSVAITLLASLFMKFFLARYRIVHWEEDDLHPAAKEQSNQYSMRFLLLSMIAVAILCILIRFTLPQNDRDWLDATDYPSVAVWFVWLSLGISVIGALLARCCLGPLSIIAWIAMAILTLLGPLLFQIVASQLIFRPEWGADEFMFYVFDQSLAIAYLLEFGLLVFFALGLVVTRWIGYRIVDSSENSTNAV